MLEIYNKFFPKELATIICILNHNFLDLIYYYTHIGWTCMMAVVSILSVAYWVCHHLQCVYNLKIGKSLVAGTVMLLKYK